MFDANDNDAAANRHQPSDAHEPKANYLAAAREAYDSGDRVLAMHLYLTAYEEACKRGPLPDMEAIGALREAWRAACELKERSMAEYIFDRLESHLSADETADCARKLQDLALDKLSEFGISRTDLEDMADLISEEIGAQAHISGITPIVSTLYSPSDEEESEHADDEEAEQEAPALSRMPASVHIAGGTMGVIPSPQPEASANPGKAERKTRRGMCFDDLVGFDGVIEDTRALGLGIKQDEEYRLLVDTLRAQHGLEKLSAAGSVVFRTSSREDASLFMTALVGELELPAMRVQVQPGPQGMPVLCVTVSADRQPRMNARMSLSAPGVLVLEDIDLWGAQIIEAASAAEGEGIMFASMARAAREAVTLIGAAVANPDIHVLASMASDSSDQNYLYDMMEPMSIVDIYMPDEVERRLIWERAAKEHPSIRKLDLSQLTRLSRNLSRSDIAFAAREAVEDAYRQSLRARHYVPVTQEMMYEHVASFQPLESDEYRTLEDAIVADFRNQISEIEHLIDSGGDNAREEG